MNDCTRPTDGNQELLRTIQERLDAERARRIVGRDDLYPEYPDLEAWEKDAIRENGWMIRVPNGGGS